MTAPFASILDLRDVDGRPVGEGKAAPEVRQGVPFDYRRCSYAGSRRHHPLPMNVSALKQMLAEWPAVLALLGWFRRIHLAETDRTEVRLIDLWTICRIGLTLPEYLNRRHRRPLPDGALPAALGGAFKVLAGLGPVLRQLIVGAVLDRPDRLAEIWTPQQLIATIEQQGFFVGEREVCAGPRKHIEAAFAVLIDGDPVQPVGGDVVAFGTDRAAWLTLARLHADFQLGTGLFDLLWPSMARAALAPALAGAPVWVGREISPTFRRQARVLLRDLSPSLTGQSRAAASSRLRAWRDIAIGPATAGEASRIVGRLIDAYTVGSLSDEDPTVLVDRYAAAERAWLELCLATEIGVFAALERPYTAPALSEVDTMVPENAWRRFLRQHCGLTVIHDGAASRVGHRMALVGAHGFEPWTSAM